MKDVEITPKEYVEKYYKSYASGDVDQEIKATGTFLIENTKGKVLDCGCGPVPQLWSIFMPNMEGLYAIDLPQESIDFAKDKIAHVNEWHKDFNEYQKVVEEKIGSLPDDYVIKQVSQIQSVQQADMTKNLPFPQDYFDTVISLYSLGCLKNEEELKTAIQNINRVLKPGGVLLHINTNGENKNDALPAYTWNGLSQSSLLIEDYLTKEGFTDITRKEVVLNSNSNGMYKYDTISLLRAVKPMVNK